MQIVYLTRRISDGVPRILFTIESGNLPVFNVNRGVTKHSISYLCSPYIKRKKFAAEIFTLDCIERRIIITLQNVQLFLQRRRLRRTYTCKY